MAGDDGDGSSSNDSEAPPLRRGLTARNKKDPDRDGAGGPGKQKVRRTQSMNLEYVDGDQEDAGNTKEHSDQLVNALLGNPNDSGVG